MLCRITKLWTDGSLKQKDYSEFKEILRTSSATILEVVSMTRYRPSNRWWKGTEDLEPNCLGNPIRDKERTRKWCTNICEYISLD